MYFPYLYARRSELLALRRIVEELDIRQTTIPIFEPVKADSADLRRALESLGRAGNRVMVVMNPSQGEFKANGSRPGASVRTWRNSIRQQIEEFPTIVPAFICRPETRFTDIQEFLRVHPDRDVATIYWSCRLSNGELQDLANTRPIAFHVNLHDSLSAERRRLLPTRKAVDVADRFNSQKRNADYGQAEFFSDKHLNFRENSVGFGDYSVAGSVYTPGGGPAYAVAVHAVFREPEAGTLWVEHFVSDDTDITVGTTAAKFVQAARKLVRAARSRPTEFGTNAALLAYAEDVRASRSPGLMANKQRQIYHHIALNHQILSNIV